MKILIFGGSGFIGKNLINKLSQKDLILIVSNKSKIKHKSKNIKIIKQDLLKPFKKEIINFQPDIIYNLCWYGIPNFNFSNCIINLRISINIINNLEKFKYLKKIIFAGSCKEYLESSNKINEKSKLNLIDDFSITKNFIKSYLIYICKLHKIKYNWVSIFYVYGQYQRKASLIPYLVNSIKSRKKLKINNLYYKCDFIYIDDLIEFLNLLKKNINQSGIYNIGYSKLYSVKDVIGIIHKIFEKEVKLDKSSLKSKMITNNKFLLSDISKAKNKLGWIPKTSLNMGIKKYIENEY